MQATATAEITRPANTTAYAVGDVVTGTVAAVLEFANLAAYPNGLGRVIGGSIQKSTANITNAKFRLWLYAGTIATVGADNAPAVLRYADKESYLGTVEFPLMVQDGSSVFSAIAIDNELSIPFKCIGAKRNLYGVLVAEGAYAPGNAETFFIRLAVERE